MTDQAQQVIAAAKKYSDKGHPYVYGAKGEMLCKGNKSLIEGLKSRYSKKSNFNHVLGSEKDNNGKNWNWTMSQASTDYVGIDCSGLTAAAFKNGINKDIGAGSSNQGANGEKVGGHSPSKALPGDLLWRDGHVGIMGNNNRVIEAKGWAYGCVEGVTEASKFTKAYTLANTTGTTTNSTSSTTNKSSSNNSGNLLTASQQSSAITYNKKNNQSICTKIQGLVGVEQDGSFGPITVNAIAKWQSQHKLEVDGKFGPASKAAAGFTGSNNNNNTTTQPTNNNKPAENKPSGNDNYTGNSDVAYGSKNEQGVRTLQRLLNNHGAGISQDGAFGPGTARALMRFQYHYVYKDAPVFFQKIHSSGKKSVCDTATWNALRQNAPSAVNEPGKGIAFSRSGQRLTEVPTADIQIGGKNVGKMNPTAAKKFNEMASASGGKIWGVTSTFRGMTNEATKAITGGVGGSSGAIELYVAKNFNANLAAVPGTSYHCSGNAVDIAGFADKTAKPAVWTWLHNNASKYGFSGISSETWHWNYKG